MVLSHRGLTIWWTSLMWNLNRTLNPILSYVDFPHHMADRLVFGPLRALDKTIIGNVSDRKIALQNWLKLLWTIILLTYNTPVRPITQTVLREGDNLNVICKVVFQHTDYSDHLGPQVSFVYFIFPCPTSVLLDTCSCCAVVVVSQEGVTQVGDQFHSLNFSTIRGRWKRDMRSSIFHYVAVSRLGKVTK